MKIFKHKKKLIPVFAACIIIFTAGCAPKQAHYPVYKNPTDAKWVAEDIDGKPIKGFAHIWMRLDKGGKIYGSGGCNSFRGEYSYINGIFKTGPLAMTKKLCTKNMNLQEFRFMQALDRVDSMQERNGMLYMEGNDNSLLFYKGH